MEKLINYVGLCKHRFAILFFVTMFSLPTTVCAGLLDSEPLPASWISYDESLGTSPEVLHFRKAFDISEVPKKFLIHVSADNQYRLFINGDSVFAGPQRSDLMHWRYDTVDLGPFLKKGKNVISAVVWNWAQLKPAAQHSLRTAFLVQGNSKRESIVNTGEKWKVLKNSSHTFLSVPWEQAGGYYVSAPGEEINGNGYPSGWKSEDFNDSQWNEAAALRIPVFERGNFDGSTGGWLLTPRTIPPMRESSSRYTIIRRADGIDVDEDFLTGTSELKVPPNTKAAFLIDQAHLTNAYTRLETSGGKGSTITLTYAESLKDENGNKGNRDQIDGKTISGVQDIFHPGGRSKQEFQTLWFRTYRYVQVMIETGSDELVIHDMYGISTGYPFDLKAKFISDEPWLENMWEMNWRTARLCAFDMYFDTPYYEQLQYIGDTRIQSLLSFYMSDDDRLVRQAIEHFNMSRNSEGLTSSRYPSDPKQYIPPFSLIWVTMVHDFWMYNNDPNFVKSQLLGTRDVLSWFDDRISEKGILGPLTWWPFADWADSWKRGTPPGSTDAGSILISFQFVYALQRAAELEQAFGSQEFAAQYLKRADSLIKAAYNVAWDDKRKLFLDTPGGSEFSQQTNAMAVLIGAIADAKRNSFMKRVLSDSSITQSTYYFTFYLFEAMELAGLGSEYIAQLAPWKGMLEAGLTTTPETPEPTRSDSHAWSSHPNYGLLAIVLGVRPAEPGFKSVIIKPNLGPLKMARGVIPHPLGEIEVDLHRVGSDGMEAVLSLPEEITGVFKWNGEIRELKAGVNKFRL